MVSAHNRHDHEGHDMTKRIASRLPALLFPLCLAAAASLHAAGKSVEPPLVPRAALLQPLEGRLVLGRDAHFLPAGDGARAVLAQFVRLAGDALPAAVRQAPNQPGAGGAVIGLRIVPGLDVPAEGYRLEITPRGGRLEAADAHGLFNGAMTLLQLLRRVL
ncbi:MAG: hypothetical protein EOO78_12295, partial [Oxalobacteraceae bacterium]